MLRIFIGYDHRQPVAYNVLQQSIIRYTSQPVQITPIIYKHVPIAKERLEQGLTPFTFTRFFVPWLCDYQGHALFLDIDMVLNADISELFELIDSRYAVQVVKNKKRFEWASLMLFNCEKCTLLTPQFINYDSVNQKIGLHTIEWVSDELIGDLPPEWNHCVGYDEINPHAKLIHFTQGVPCFEQTLESEHSSIWFREHQYMNFTVPWIELMGGSVHTKKVNGEVVAKLTTGNENNGN